MARPQATTIRRKQVNLRLSQTEHDTIAQAALARGVSTSAFCRLAALALARKINIPALNDP